MEEEKPLQPDESGPSIPVERTEDTPPTYQVRVRYGISLERGVFATTLPDLEVGEMCIIRSPRGVEWGEVTGVLSRDPVETVAGRVLRRPSDNDLSRIQELEAEGTEKEFSFCKEKIEEHELPMNLVSVEKLFSRDKIIFYFTANGRVDFRALVKTLAQAYRKRIELKQIGVRDEAKVLGCVGHCGRELCCRSFIENIEQVTMKMAKMQKSTLDPTKISGRCGRLMCCLRFEDKVYREMKSELPNRGEKVWTEKGEVVVLDQRILGQRLLVQGPGGDRYQIALAEVLDGPPPPKPPPPPPPRRREPRPTEPRGGPKPPRPPRPEEKRGKPQPAKGGGRGGRRSRGRGRRRPQGEGGGKPSRPRDGERPRRPRDGERPRRPHDGEQPRRPHDGERPRRPHDGERPRRPHDGERSRRPHDGERPRRPHDGERPRRPHDGERRRRPHDGERPSRPSGPPQGGDRGDRQPRPGRPPGRGPGRRHGRGGGRQGRPPRRPGGSPPSKG
ncbi:MAG: PSP1 domain-containing protein [Planctomycetota bacterium]